MEIELDVRIGFEKGFPSALSGDSSNLYLRSEYYEEDFTDINIGFSWLILIYIVVNSQIA